MRYFSSAALLHWVAWGIAVSDIQTASSVQLNVEDSEGAATRRFNANEARVRVFQRARADVAKIETIRTPGMWMIVGGKLYVRKDSPVISPTGPQNSRLMTRLITSVLENSCAHIPDVSFDVLAGSAGVHNVTRPVLAIARKVGGAEQTRGGILVPNPWFLGIRAWAKESDAYRRAAQQLPWDRKDGRVFWRGTVKSPSSLEDGNRERLQCTLLSKTRPDLFDLKVSRTTSEVPTADYCQHKYLMNLPGVQHGSYSRNLNHLWLHGSAVMLWESSPGKGLNYEEWYYPGLAKSMTHLEVGPHNAVEAVDFLKRNDPVAQNFAKAGAMVHDTFTCPCCIADHFVGVFNLLSEKMAFDPATVLMFEPDKWQKFEPEPEERKGADKRCLCGLPPL